MVFAPLPVIAAVLLIALFPRDVVAVGFVLPLDVIGLLVGSPDIDLAVVGAACAEEWKCQCRCQQKAANPAHLQHLSITEIRTTDGEMHRKDDKLFIELEFCSPSEPWARHSGITLVCVALTREAIAHQRSPVSGFYAETVLSSETRLG